jgi:hypothetical protein
MLAGLFGGRDGLQEELKTFFDLSASFLTGF